MKLRHTPLLLAFTFSIALVVVSGYSENTNPTSNDTGVLVRVNGVLQDGSIQMKNTANGLLVDAQAFASKLSGVLFFRMLNPPIPGITLQYGKRISFASNGLSSGFCSAEKVAMEPPIEFFEDMYWAPLNFFAKAVLGEIQMEDGNAVIDVTMPLPNEIGDIVPEARAIAQQLEEHFYIQQGEIVLSNAIEFYTAGYAPDCNGNNASASYLVVQNPPSPRNEVLNMLPMIIQMDQDEAFVWVGYTPPECKYFSYQLYLVNRYYDDEDPPTRKKIYARLGDSINSYNLPLHNDPFKKFFVFIIANNQNTHRIVKTALGEAGIAQDRILSLVIPDQTDPDLEMKFGLDMSSDSFNFLHRASVFERDVDKDAYVNNPTLEVLRVTPKTELTRHTITRPDHRERQAFVREQNIAGLGGLLERLQTAINTAHAGNYQYTRLLNTSTWMYPGGDVAIEDRENVLGETNDTLYLKTEEFVLHEEDLIVVFGVNHDKTGKSVYSNVSCYGKEADNGVGGITSTPWSPDAPGRISYFGTAEEYLPNVGAEQQEMLYVYKFARSPIDESTFVIPYNHDKSYTGFNNGDTVFMGFRIYVDLLTTIGPYPGDTEDGNYFPYTGPDDSAVFFDQAILFTNTPP